MSADARGVEHAAAAAAAALADLPAALLAHPGSRQLRGLVLQRTPEAGTLPRRLIRTMAAREAQRRSAERERGA